MSQLWPLTLCRRSGSWRVYRSLSGKEVLGLGWRGHSRQWAYIGSRGKEGSVSFICGSGCRKWLGIISCILNMLSYKSLQDILTQNKGGGKTEQKYQTLSLWRLKSHSTENMWFRQVLAILKTCWKTLQKFNLLFFYRKYFIPLMTVFHHRTNLMTLSLIPTHKFLEQDKR